MACIRLSCLFKSQVLKGRFLNIQRSLIFRNGINYEPRSALLKICPGNKFCKYRKKKFSRKKGYSSATSIKKVSRSVKGRTKSFVMTSFVFLFPLVPFRIKFWSSGLVKLSQQRWVVFCDFLDSFLWQKFSVKQFSLKQHNLKMKLLRDLKPKPVRANPCERSTLISQST